MKIRLGFVSNSSSSSFCITNKTDEEKNIIDLINEVGRFWLKEYIEKSFLYDGYRENVKTDEDFENLYEKIFNEIKLNFELDKYTLKSKESKYWTFWDDTYYECMIRYGLRIMKETESFSWVEIGDWEYE
jgi:hypothetical protein